MKATLCDRCGKQYDPSKRGDRKYTVRTVRTEVVRKQMSRGTEVDICPECYQMLVDWFENRKELK